MKRLTLLLSLLLVTGLAFAGVQDEAKTHKLTAEVISVDANAGKIVVKNEEGKEMTAKVEAEAAKSLADLKAGDKVMLTCRDSASGQHEAVVAVEKVDAKAAANKPPKPAAKP